jgi:tetratricopeptide repeat protein/Leucine Rich Repeat (LRR) protein
VKFTGANVLGAIGLTPATVPHGNLAPGLESEADYYKNEARRMILAGIAPPVAWSPFLDALEFRFTGLKDLEPLVGLTHLSHLGLSHTRVCNLSALSNLGTLVSLDLSGTEVVDLSVIKSLTKLRYLSLRNMRVDNIKSLGQLPDLECLDLKDTPITDLSALVDFAHLQFLDLSDTCVDDIDALSNLARLEVLHLENTPVSDIGVLRQLGNLQRIYLSGTGISDLSPLSALRDLRRVDFTGLYPVKMGLQEILESTLANCEKYSGPEHVDTAVSLAKLAGWFHELGDLERATPLYQRSLKILEPIFGTDPYDTARPAPHDPPLVSG